jgi:hypothetical protein
MKNRTTAARLCALALSVAASVSLAPTALAARPPLPDGDWLDLARPENHVKCTGWTSQFTPPRTIRVLRSALDLTYDSANRHPEWDVPRDIVGKVQEVPFQQYVETVMGVEWGSNRSLETAKAAAIAVKQFAWYYTMHGRSSYVAADGQCYDVKDTNVDQLYWPERNYTKDYHRQVVAATWRTSLRQVIVTNANTGATALTFFLTGYRSGTDVPCGSDADGFRLRAKSAYRCGTELGYSRESIQRAYYTSTLQIVTPGAHHIFGTVNGDAAVVVPGETSTSPGTARVFSGDTTAFAAPDGPSLGFAPSRVHSVRSADVDGNGFDDMLVLARGATGYWEVTVHRSDGTTYLPPVVWWSSGIQGPAVGLNLKITVNDYDADGKADLGILSGLAEAPFYVMLSTGTGFLRGAEWSRGAIDFARTTIQAGDVTGDGRADLITQSLTAQGLLTSVRPSQHGVPGTNAGKPLGAPVQWALTPGATIGAYRATTLDLDRDGRDDLVTTGAGAGGVGTVVTAMRSTGTTFKAVETLWGTPAEAPVPLADFKIGNGDVNGDGFGDVLLYQRDPAGLRVGSLVSDGTKVTPGPFRVETGIVWSTAIPY